MSLISKKTSDFQYQTNTINNSVMTMSWLHKSTRKKNIDAIPVDTSLRRCLSTVDLTLMGVGSMVGSGIYIMTGVAAKELAGEI